MAREPYPCNGNETKQSRIGLIIQDRDLHVKGYIVFLEIVIITVQRKMLHVVDMTLR